MRSLFHVIALTALTAAGARAGDITITFESPALTGSPGDTLQFFANITNSGSSDVYLNGDTVDLALSAASYSLSDLSLSNLPLTLAAGDSTGDLELFDVTLSDPLSDPFGTYDGVYTLLGGADGDAQDNLAQASFSVDAQASPSSVPEPATFALLGFGLISLAWLDAKQGRAGSPR